MTWLKLDDGFADHPKIDQLSDGAFRLHVAGMLYCARHLTDGQIPARAVPRLIPGYAPDFAGELVDADLWHEAPDGSFSVHDYLEWNPSAELVKAKRRARSDAGRKGGRASAQARARTTPTEANTRPDAEANARPDARTPSRPVPSRPSSSSKPPPPSPDAAAPALAEEDEEADDTRTVTYAAAEIIARRVLALRDPALPVILNPPTWITATATARAASHHDQALELLTADPALTPAALADLLEPSLAPPTPPRPRDRDCPDCAGSLWVDHDAGVAPCERCHA